MNSLYMVTLTFPPGEREKILSYFASHGTTDYSEHIELLTHWTSLHEPMSFLLVACKDDEQARLAFAEWGTLGEITSHKVIDAIDY